MPRIRQEAAKYAAKDFAKEIRIAGTRMGLNTVKEIAEYTEFPPDTLRLRLRQPETLKFKEIFQLAAKLRMPLETFECLVRGERTKS